MRSRLTKAAAAIAAITALAFGGAALAGAVGNSNLPAKAPAASQGQEPVAPDGDNVQQGDQSTPDTGAATEQAQESNSESAPESASSESDQSDGPGGYADTNANADTQQQGEH